MANRSIAIRMRADVSGFTAEMAKARTSLDQVVKAADKNAQVADTAGGRMVQSARLQADEWSAVGNTLLGVGAVGTAAFGGIIKVTSDFETQMSAVQAATLASSNEMDTLREAAKQAGADTAFSATEAAQGIEELAKAGVSTQDILGGGLKGALDLAAAGGISVQESAESAASALTQFSLSGEDVPHVADLLAAAAGKAQGGVTEMSQALSQAGLVASNSGLSIEETVGTLAAFASAGLLGSDAGTSFKSMLQRLQNPSKESAELMKELGLSLYDANGNMVGMSNLAGQLQTKLSGMTQAQRDATFAQIFGSDAVRAANVLYKEGADGIQGWIENVNEAGYASETAAARQDNLAGKWEAFTGSLETLAITVGEMILPALEWLVEGATDVVNVIESLPEPVIAVGAALGGILTAATLAGGAFFKLAPSVIETWTAFGNLASQIPGVSRALGAVSGPAGKAASGLGKIAKWGGIPVAAVATIGAATKGFLELTGLVDRTVQGLEELQNSVNRAQSGGGSMYDAIIGPIGDINTQQFTDLAEVFERIARPGVADSTIGSWFGGALDSTGFKEVSQQLEVLDQQMTQLSQTDLSAATGQFKAMYDEAGGGQQVFDDMMAVLPGYKEALYQLANAAGIPITDANLLKIATGQMNDELQNVPGAADGAASGLDGVSDGIDGTGDSAANAAESLNQFLDALASYGELNMSADEAALNRKQTLDGLKQSYEDAAEGVTDLNEQELIRKTTMGDLAQASQAQIQAMAAQTDANGELLYSAEEIGKQLVSNADDFISGAHAIGINGDAAVDLASDYGLIPADIDTQADFDKWKAEQDANGYKDLVGEVDGQEVNTEVKFDADQAKADADGLKESLLGLFSDPVETTAEFHTDQAIQDSLLINRQYDSTPDKTETTPYFHSGKALTDWNVFDGSLKATPSKTNTTPYFHSGKASGDTTRYKGLVNSVPGAKNTNLNVRDNGSWTIQSVKNGLASVHDKTVTLTVNRVENAVKGLFGKAYGGPIYGPGTGTSDDVPIMASNGEYMIRESATRKNRRLLDMINYGGFDAQSALGLAEGGPVDRSTMTPVSRLLPASSFTQAQEITVAGPRSLTVVDVDGHLMGTMQVVAANEAMEWVNA